MGGSCRQRRGRRNKSDRRKEGADPRLENKTNPCALPRPQSSSASECAVCLSTDVYFTSSSSSSFSFSSSPYRREQRREQRRRTASRGRTGTSQNTADGPELSQVFLHEIRTRIPPQSREFQRRLVASARQTIRRFRVGGRAVGDA